MFTKELSQKIVKLIDERNLTVEALANAAGLTREYVTNIKNGRQVPSLTSFEKLCSALEVEPNDLLLSNKSSQPGKCVAKQVTDIYYPGKPTAEQYFPICPTCKALLHSNWESYCNLCGQKLSWSNFVYSKVTRDRPKRIRENMGDYD